MTTNVPAVQFTPQGLIIPTAKEVLDGVLNDFNAAFGGNLNLNLETPQGQLASSIAAIINDKNNQLAWLLNNLDPDYSDGIMQDAIGKIYFVKRKGQINSAASCIFVGLPGTTIPEGFIVKDTLNNEWVLNDEISILSNGRVTGAMTAKGIYSAKANTITEIKQNIIGLDRVYNPSDATIGSAAESRADFAERYKKSVAINSNGTLASVYSNVASLDGVTDCYAIENNKSTPVTVGASNYQLSPHSVYVAVVGGNNNDIAKAIWKYSGNGCDYNGNTIVTIKDDTYHEPKPTYEIKFMRPTPLPIYFQVKLKTGALEGYSAMAKESIKTAFNGKNKAKIGSIIYAISYVSFLVNDLSGSHLLDVKVGKSKGSYSDSVEIGINQYPTIADANIEVILV
ncbi:baseplate J/gp47 family protein [Testudinibacter sp. P80/BLE/0925]